MQKTEASMERARSHAPSHTRTPNTAIPTPTSPNTTVAALVVVVVAPLVLGFVIWPDVPFPFPVFDPPVVPVPPPPVRLTGDPKDAVGILEIVDHVPPERGGRRGVSKGEIIEGKERQGKRRKRRQGKNFNKGKGNTASMDESIGPRW